MTGQAAFFCIIYFHMRLPWERYQISLSEKRSIRGGSFGLNAAKLRTTNRGSAAPTHFGFYDGFRCAQSLG
jgi:hypothetical protein